MMLADRINGPDWAIYGVVVLFALLSLVLLSGRGSWLIAGYNTAPKEKKARYDEKKLCRVTGAGLAVVDLLLLVMALFQDTIPASWGVGFVGAILLIAIGIVVASNTLCKKQ